MTSCYTDLRSREPLKNLPEGFQIDSKQVGSFSHDHLGSVWYHSEPPQRALILKTTNWPGTIFCGFLQQTGSNLTKFLLSAPRPTPQLVVMTPTPYLNASERVVWISNQATGVPFPPPLRSVSHESEQGRR